MNEEKSLTLWNSNAGAPIPRNISTFTELVPYNKRLYPRELIQIEKAFENDLYDMSIEYTWTRTVNIIKEKVMSFGEEFVLEMLGRSDKDSISTLSDTEIIRLASDLGIINETAKLRFLHIIELIAHFSSRKISDDEIGRLDALNNIQLCMKYVLAQEEDGFQISYNNFRDRLKQESLDEYDEIVQTLVISPYFYKRTTMRTLLNLLKSSKGAEVENVYNNMLVIIPEIWEDLLSDDRYDLGVVYAEAANNNQEKLIKALKAVLLKVRGFDYVPEDLRSRSFIEVAKKLLDLHHGFDNFYKEPSAAKSLQSMGTSIPKPALGPCMTAVLASKLGNRYGRSDDAQSALDNILDHLNEERWRYYFDATFLADDEILYKLMQNSSKINSNWTGLVKKYKLNELTGLHNTQINKLLTASNEGNFSKVFDYAEDFYFKLRGRK